jgi:hypothetical protein
MIRLCSVEKNIVTVELSVELSGSMLESEDRIQSAVNEAGVALSREALKRFDTDGSPVMTGAFKWTSKGQVDKVYHTARRGSGDMCTRAARAARLIVHWTSTRASLPVRRRVSPG